MREVKDYIDEAFKTLEDSYEETSEYLQKKKGIMSNVLIEHIEDFYESKTNILRLLRSTPVSIFDEGGFREEEKITELDMNTLHPYYGDEERGITTMHYLVGVFNIERNRVVNHTRFEIDNKIMHPNNINEYMDGIDTLVDEIVLHLYSCGNPDTCNFEYIKNRY